MDFILNEYHRNVSDEELLTDMKRVAEKLKTNTLTRQNYRKHGRYASATVIKHFGRWNKALELCGMQLNVHQLAASLGKHEHLSVDTDELLDDIKRVAVLLGKETISSLEYGKHGIYSRSLCTKRFPSWNDALQQAGLRPFKRVLNRRLDDEDMLKEIERIWIQLGRQPTSSDMKAGISLYSLDAYREHFGSWRGALQAFIKYINGEEPIVEFISEEEPTTEVISSRKSTSEESTVIQSQTDTPRHRTPRDVNYRLRFKVMQRDNFRCCLCGASPAKDSSVELHVDHIFPWAKGGETTMDNLQTLCSVCNLGKSDLVL